MISGFDQNIDARKQAIRLGRWRQILRFKRKPNKIQRAILMEDLNLWITIGVCLTAFALYSMQ